METTVSDIQRQLTGSNLSDDEYRPLLLEFLHQQNLKPHIEALQGNDLQEFVDCLDSALNRISTTDDLFRGTLHRLRSACGNRGVLPSSYFIPNEMISNRGGPVAAGGFADVYEAEFNGKKVCVKALREYSQDTDGVTKKAFHKEVVVWKRLQHPNIVTFLGVPTKIPPFEIVCEWMENGRIDNYVARHPHVDLIGLLWDVADGLHYLHSSEVIHGDLKAANILIDDGGHARLTDFGLASIIRRDTSVVSPQDSGGAKTGTWVAPEILRGGASTKEGDIFTFAMVAVETFTGHPPFTMSLHSASLEIMNGKRPQRPGKLSHDGLWELMQRCWDQDPVKRPGAFELVKFFHESFPGKREAPRTQALPNAPSTWTLARPEAHPNVNASPRLDPPRQDTMDGDEPGPHDPSTGSPLTARTEPPTSTGGQKASVTGKREPRRPAEPKENTPPPAQSDPSPARRPMSKFRKFVKKLSCF